MSCRCHHPLETGRQYVPRTDTSEIKGYECQRRGSYRSKCPVLNDEAWNALSSLREKTCHMFSSGTEGTGAYISGKCHYTNEPMLESGNILRKANDLIDYAPESEFLKKMKQQCQYLQSNQSNIFSAMDEGIEGDSYDYHKPKEQFVQMEAPKCESPTSEAFVRLNYNGNPQMDYMDYDEMHLNPFSYELQCNAQNMQPQPVVEVSCEESHIQPQWNEDKKSEHVSRSRKPVKCRGLRKRKSGNAGKCESVNQFEPTLKKPHENSCDRCWRYASPSRSPVNKPDQKYDPNFRRGHSRIDFERGDGDLEGRESYTSPCSDSETCAKKPSPPRFPHQKFPGRSLSPSKPATAPVHYSESPTAQYPPSPRDMQSYPREQSTSPPRPMHNYPVGTPSTFPRFGGGQKDSPNLSLPVGIPKSTADRSPKMIEDFSAALSSTVSSTMPRSPTAETCPGGVPLTFPVTKPTRSAANYPTEPPSFLSAMPSPPYARSSSPESMHGSSVGSAAPLPTCLEGSPGVQYSSPKKVLQNYSSSRSPSPNKTMQNYSRVQSSSVPRNMQNISGAKFSLLPNTMPRSPGGQSPSRGMENYSSLQNPSSSWVNFSSSPSSSVQGSVPRPASSPRPMQNYSSDAPSPRSAQICSPKTVSQKCVQFHKSPQRATDRNVQNFNTCNQPCPAVPQGLIYSASGRKERPISFIPDLGPAEVNRCYDGMEELDVTEYKVFTPMPKNQVYQQNSSIQSCEPSDLRQTEYNKSSSLTDQTFEVPVIPRPCTHSVENSPSSRQSPGRLKSIPEGKSSSTKTPKSKSPKNTSKHTSPKTRSPSQGKAGKSKSPERSNSGHKKGRTKSPSPKPGTSKAEASRSSVTSPKKSEKSSPRKCGNTSGEKQCNSLEKSQIAVPSKDYHCGTQVVSGKAKEWYFESDHPLNECSCFPRVPVFTNDPDNFDGSRIFCCHCEWNKSGNQKPRSGSGEKQTPTKSGSCNCSRQRTPQTPKEFDGVAFPCPYRRASDSSGQDNGLVPPEGGREQPRGTKPSPQQQQNLFSNPAESPPRKYVVYYMTKCKEKKRDEDEVEVLVEEFSRCPKEIDSRTNDITEKMKRIMDCPSDSMALRFQKGVSDSAKSPPSSRILYF